jgi:hypothetical protein
MKNKACTNKTCKQVNPQSLSNFNKKKSVPCGFSSWCKSCESNNHAAYYRNNKERTISRVTKRYKEKHEQCRKEQNDYHKLRMKTDPLYKIRHRLRTRIYNVMKNSGNRKTNSPVKNLGCSIEELKAHLESKFQPGMSWSNHGEWHVDHIKPLSSFNLTNVEEFKQACHYTNLQPLWAIDNLKKSDKT